MNEILPRPIEEFLDDSEQMLTALRGAVAAEMERHRRLGEPVAVSRAGATVIGVPGEIPVPAAQLSMDERRRFAAGRLLSTLWELERHATANHIDALCGLDPLVTTKVQETLSKRRVA